MPELAEKVVKWLKKKKEKIDVGSAATGSILNTVTEMATFSSGGINRNHHDTNEKIKPNNTHRIRPNTCSICESDGKVGNRSKENSLKKNKIESKYDPSESSFKSVIPPPPPPPQTPSFSLFSINGDQVRYQNIAYFRVLFYSKISFTKKAKLHCFNL